MSLIDRLYSPKKVEIDEETIREAKNNEYTQVSYITADIYYRFRKIVRIAHVTEENMASELYSRGIRSVDVVWNTGMELRRFNNLLSHLRKKISKAGVK